MIDIGKWWSIETYITCNKEELKKDPDRYRGYFINDPEWACYFAYHIDGKPRDDTRAISCTTKWTAYYYAFMVEEKFHPVSWEALKGTEWEPYYLDRVGKPE